MDPQSNSSFIPKQSRKVSVPKNRRTVSFPFFTVFAHALFVGVMLAAAVVFVYNQYTVKQLQQSVATLDQAVTNFNVTDLKSVVNFDKRIRAAEKILNYHISINKALSVVESSLVSAIDVESISFDRVDSEILQIIISAKANELDFLIFQRDLFRGQNNPSIIDSEILNVNYMPVNQESGLDTSKQVMFDIEIKFNAEMLKTDFSHFADETNNLNESSMAIDSSVTDNDSSPEDDRIDNDLEE